MLHSLGITHVVSVGESLITCPPDCDPMYGQVGPNTLAAEHAAGRIQVCDLNDVRDDGNDPLRPLIAKACTWIEQARRENGVVLVHCVSGKGGLGRKMSGRVGSSRADTIAARRGQSKREHRHCVHDAIPPHGPHGRVSPHPCAASER
jgi:hypothetical protein